MAPRNIATGKINWKGAANECRALLLTLSRVHFTSRSETYNARREIQRENTASTSASSTIAIKRQSAVSISFHLTSCGGRYFSIGERLEIAASSGNQPTGFRREQPHLQPGTQGDALEQKALGFSVHLERVDQLSIPREAVTRLPVGANAESRDVKSRVAIEHLLELPRKLWPIGGALGIVKGAQIKRSPGPRIVFRPAGFEKTEHGTLRCIAIQRIMTRRCGLRRGRRLRFHAPRAMHQEKNTYGARNGNSGRSAVGRSTSSATLDANALK